MQDEIGEINSVTSQLKKQAPGKSPAGRRHFRRAWFLRVNRLVIVEIPWCGDVFVTNRLAETVK